MSYIYDALLWVDAAGRILPWLASRYETSSDGLTYTFELRNGARWHDGMPVTPQDVEFTFDYYRSQGAALPPFVIIQPPAEIVAVKATGGPRVEVRLDKPLVTFVQNFAARLPIVPRPIWASIDDASQQSDLRVLVGSGPYRLESYTRGEGSYLYTANDDFFLGRPFVERIEMRPVDNELTALLAGEITAGGPRPTGATPDTLAPFLRDDSFGLIRGEPDLTVALYWNQTKGGPLGDLRFRQACALAIDRGDIVRRVVGGQGEAGNPGFLPPTHPFHVEVEQYPFDRAAANRLLDEAGYMRGDSGVRQGSDGRPLRFQTLVIPEVAPVVDLVKRALEEVGVELDLDPTDFTGMVAAMVRGDYELAIPLYGNLSGDPDFMRTVYSSRAPKVFLSAQGYANPEFDELADQQRYTADETRRRELIARMQDIVAADLPLVPLYYPTRFHIFKTDVFDQWTFTPTNGFLGGPYNKQLFVTGARTGGLEIRPTSPPPAASGS